MYKYEHVLLWDFIPEKLERKEPSQAVHAVHVCVKAVPSICADQCGSVCACVRLHTCVRTHLLETLFPVCTLFTGNSWSASLLVGPEDTEPKQLHNYQEKQKT